LNRTIVIGILILFSVTVFAQKILVIENKKSLKNIKYYQGDDIMIKIVDFKSKLKDRIVDMTDSSLILEGRGEVDLKNILCIYRENWLIETLRGLSLLGGVAYFGLDSFNRMINHEYPVIQMETVYISAGMVAFSFALTPLRYRMIRTTEKWELRTIDLASY
jgi:hypothetical protein